MARASLPPLKVICGQTQGLGAAQDVLCVTCHLNSSVHIRAGAEICTKRFRVPARNVLWGLSGGRSVYGVVQERQEEVGTVSSAANFFPK